MFGLPRASTRLTTRRLPAIMCISTMLFVFVVACLVSAVSAQDVRAREDTRLVGERRAPEARYQEDFGNVAARIIGGQVPADITKYSHAVAIFMVQGGNEYFRCGGTLITDSHVLSAAHCFFDDAGVSNVDDYSAVHVRLGAQEDVYAGVTSYVTQINGHPQFDGSSFDNDVAVLTLASPVDVQMYVPVTLSWDPSDVVAEGQIMGKIVGWGTREDGRLSSQLIEGDVPIVSRAQCTSAGSYNPADILPSHICAGYVEGGIDSCQGDSGGPLSVNSKQVGIVSWGDGCALARKYGVYFHVAASEGFIGLATDSRVYEWSPTDGSIPSPPPTPSPPSTPPPLGLFPFPMLSLFSLFSF